jgi:hypothetical protein
MGWVVRGDAAFGHAAIGDFTGLTGDTAPQSPGRIPAFTKSAGVV